MDTKFEIERQIRDEQKVNKYMKKTIDECNKNKIMVDGAIQFLNGLYEKLEGKKKVSGNDFKEVYNLINT